MALVGGTNGRMVTAPPRASERVVTPPLRPLAGSPARPMPAQTYVQQQYTGYGTASPASRPLTAPPAARVTTPLYESQTPSAAVSTGLSTGEMRFWLAAGLLLLLIAIGLLVLILMRP